MIICLCQRGNVRSATTAQVLRDFFGIGNVMATGIQTTSRDTLQFLAANADIIIIGDEGLVAQFRAICPDARFIHLNIGIDRWMMPAHPDLVETVTRALQDAGFKQAGSFGEDPQTYFAAHRAAWARHHMVAA